MSTNRSAPIVHIHDHVVTFLNPQTCGIYKSGGVRYKTDAKTGKRTSEVDNELLEAVDQYLAGEYPPCQSDVPLARVLEKRILVPTYYDARFNAEIRSTLEDLDTVGVTLGQLHQQRVLNISGGHGSPPNDQRAGHIPYIKVSDIRAMRVNVNPTNLVSSSVARRLWRGKSSGLEPWDLVTPNRASSNIGEFAIILPGEESVVLTKEVFVLRVIDRTVWDPFYLLWALSLKSVRAQWKRIALMQTNREDCGPRFQEIVVPKPVCHDWALEQSSAFRDYFETIADARKRFTERISRSGMEYIATAFGQAPSSIGEAESVD